MFGDLEHVGRRFHHLARDLIVKATRPILPAVGTIPVDPPEVMNDVSAANDHHATVAKLGISRAPRSR